MIDKNLTYAIVGASNHHKKYGYIVSKDLLDAWYKVFLVNPKEKKILWQKVYQNLKEIPTQINVAIFVLPPKHGEFVITKIKKLWINKVRLQPGAENSIIIQYCKDHDIECIHNSCIMIQKNKKSQ